MGFHRVVALEWTPQLVNGIGQVQNLRIHLMDQCVQLVHGVQDLDALGVWVEAHLEWTRHGADPATELILGILEALGHIVDGLIFLILVRLHSCDCRLEWTMLALVANRVQQLTVGAQQTGAVGLDLAVFLAETELNSEPVDLHKEYKNNAHDYRHLSHNFMPAHALDWRSTKTINCQPNEQRN